MLAVFASADNSTYTVTNDTYVVVVDTFTPAPAPPYIPPPPPVWTPPAWFGENMNWISKGKIKVAFVHTFDSPTEQRFGIAIRNLQDDTTQYADVRAIIDGLNFNAQNSEIEVLKYPVSDEAVQWQRVDTISEYADKSKRIKYIGNWQYPPVNNPRYKKYRFYEVRIKTPANFIEGKGWGTKGVLKLKLGDVEYVDLEHSSFWDSDWSYRRENKVYNPTSTLSDYQTYLSTISFGSTDWEDIKSKAQADMDDFRFTSSTGIVLDYWIQDNTTTPAGFWPEVNYLATGSTTSIYMYYGNAGAGAGSNGWNTFLFFDDFSGDLSSWTVVSGNWVIQADKTLRGYGAASTDPAIKTNYIGTDYSLRAKRNLVGDDGLNLDVRFTDKSNRYFVNERSDTNKLQLQRVVAGSSDILSEISQTFVKNEWFTSEIAIVGSKVTFWFDGIKKFDNFEVGTDLSSGYAALSDWWGNPDAYFDDVFVRKYIYEEP